MKTKNIIFSLLVFLIIGCSSHDESPDCSAVTCLALGVNIKLIDKTTRVNYIDSNALELSDFMLSIGGSIEANYQILDLYKKDNNNSLLFLPFEEISSIIIDDNIVIPILMTKSLPTTDECCDSGEIETVEVSNYESEYNIDSRTLIIKI